LYSGVQRVLATAASRTVATPDAVNVADAPIAPTIGPPKAVPSGVEIMTTALRAASIAGRFAVDVDD
jgi:hypothetical protein